jgi:hypothetical protein
LYALVGGCVAGDSSASDADGATDGSAGGKSDEHGDFSLTISADGFGLQLPPDGMPPPPGTIPWIGRTVHIFVQSLDDDSRHHHAAVVDTMGGFQLELSQALRNGQQYRVLAYTEIDPANPQFGCQAGDPIGVWTLGPVDGPQILEITPELPSSGDAAADLALCNELAGAPVPRHPLKITADGFFAQNQLHNLHISVLPQTADPIPSANLGHFEWTAPAVGAIDGPGSIRFTDPNALAEGRRERILLYLEADNQAGCSASDFYGITTTDPVSGAVELTFGPDSFPQSDNPAVDLDECSKLHRDLYAPKGDYAVTIAGTGFDAFEGSTLRMGAFLDFDEPTAKIAETTITQGAFSITIPDVVPELGAVNTFLLFDADDDDRCASAGDRVFTVPAGFAGRDQNFSATPESPFLIAPDITSGGFAFPVSTLMCDRIFGTAPCRVCRSENCSTQFEACEADDRCGCYWHYIELGLPSDSAAGYCGLQSTAGVIDELATCSDEHCTDECG